MKPHSAAFKNNITNMGREIKSIVTYGNTTLEEELYAVTPHYTGNLLKSVMKQLDIESSVNIPKDTIVNYKLGLKIGNAYEYMDFGNYVVVKSEKSEDKNTYLITCYDKMVYAMKQNESLGVQYPISIKNYLTALATKIGLTVASNTFYNENKTILKELYLGLNYTYRDILDEIAQATGSIICINNDDKLEVRYPTDTNDTIDETFFKDNNVTFKETYGPINTIVLSRAAGADNIYYPNPLPQNPIEIKIIDNQIMNFNDRSEFMPGILSGLNELTYCINDYSSKGILYYELGDIYHVTIGANTYQCIMLNDEIEITQGIEETINTEMPEQSETDYSKADKTDQKINQTYLMVDKQNQVIDGFISEVTELTDITIEDVSENASVTLNNVKQSEPVMIKVHPTNQSISYLYPRNNLYPSDTLYMTNRKIRFYNTTTNETFMFELPEDLLYEPNSGTYDEFYLDYEEAICRVTKRCKYNADGSVALLDNEVTHNYSYPTISLTDGNYTVQVYGYNSAYINIKLLKQNLYTSQFATEVQTKAEIQIAKDSITSEVSETYESKRNATKNYSRIEQRADNIQSQVSNNAGDISQINQEIDEVNIEVGKKYNTSDFTNAKITAKINDGSSNVKISAEKIDLAGKTINMTSDNIEINSTNFSVDNTGKISAKSGKIAGYTIDGNMLVGSNVGISGLSGEGWAFWAGSDNANYAPFRVGHQGEMYASDVHITGGEIELVVGQSGTANFYIQSYGGGNQTRIWDGGIALENTTYSTIINLITGMQNPGIFVFDNNNNTSTYVQSHKVTTPVVVQTSKEEDKKNFEKMTDNAIEVIKGIDIYKYNLKGEEDTKKKHIGFVIGNNYKYREEVTSEQNDGVDIYSFVSLCCKAIQEQQKIIENLQKEIKEIKGE